MLKKLAKRLFTPLYLGIDWQTECLRMVLLPPPQTRAELSTQDSCLGQWVVSIPKFDAHTLPTVADHDDWHVFVMQVNALADQRRLLVNVGLPNCYFTWLHCPNAQTFIPNKKFQWCQASAHAQINQQLEYQRRAAEKLGLDTKNLLVEHLRLAPALDMLLVLNKHHTSMVQNVLLSIQTAVKKPLEGNLEPQAFTRIQCPNNVDMSYSMAWWLAQKYRGEL